MIHSNHLIKDIYIYILICYVHLLTGTINSHIYVYVGILSLAVSLSCGMKDG